MRERLLALVMVAALAPCALAAPKTAPAAAAPREYDVYAAYLRGTIGEKRASDAEIVVLETTTSEAVPFGEKSPELDAGQCKEMPADLAEALRDAFDGEDALVANQFEGLSVRIMPLAEVNAYFAAGVGEGWDAFYAHHPKSGGFYTFSPVAFDRTGTWAAMYAGHSCGGLCGGGGYVVMREVDGVWSVACEQNLWVS